jgi:hypothetical protein
MPATSLDDLHRQITQREQELECLRQELQSRHSHLDELMRHKEDLQSQLRQVEEEIAGLGATTPATKQSEAEPVTTKPAPQTASTQGQPRLRDLIEAMLKESNKPMTSRQLSEEAQRRGYKPTTQDPVSSIKARLQEMRIEGIIQRASGQPGYILAPSTNGTSKKSKPSQSASKGSPKVASKPAKSRPSTKKSSKASPAGIAVKTAEPGGPRRQTPLRLVLTGILKSSRKPLTGTELAEQALAAGYQSNSANFVDTVWAMLAKMDNVEHVPDKGYRLNRKS